MAYYPKNKIKENQYTAGKEYSYPSGKEYVGYYYVLSNGDVFSGRNPQVSFSKPLIPYSEALQKQNNPEVSFYNKLTSQDPISTIQKYQPIPIYYPILSENDYKLGSITRYFCNRIDSDSTTIKEISKETYNSLISKDGKYDGVLHTTVLLPWQISGPAVDLYRNGIIIRPGVVTTNIRQIEIANQKFPGLLGYLRNVTELARITS